MRAGSQLRVGTPTVGMRTYLCVRGGIAVDPVLGSRSHDVLSGLGPPPLAAGDVLPVGAPPAEQPRVDLAPAPADRPDPVWLRAVAGPRHEWLDDRGLLARAEWTVSDRSDRVGMRLDGPALRHRADAGQLPSEGRGPGQPAGAAGRGAGALRRRPPRSPAATPSSPCSSTPTPTGPPNSGPARASVSPS